MFMADSDKLKTLISSLWEKKSRSASPTYILFSNLKLFIFTPQVLSCLLQEQRLVFFSADWSRLTLVAESLLLYLQVSGGGTMCLSIQFLYSHTKIPSTILQHPLSFLLMPSDVPSSRCPGSSPTFPSCRGECWTSSWLLQPSSWAATSATLKRLQQ